MQVQAPDIPPELYQPTLTRLLAAQAARTPDLVGLAFEGTQLTYAQVHARADALAHNLVQRGVGAKTLVGICAYRSLELAIGLYAIHKAGGAYVPIDPEYPRDRLGFMLADSAVPILLTTRGILETLPPHAATVLLLDDPHPEPPEGASLPDGAPTDPAYMIYTSGSTGRPKGALNSHAGICNRLLWMQARYQLTESDRVLQKTPFSFDVSVWEFFWPLMTGARLVMARPGGHQDPAYLARTIQQEQISVVHFVPSMLRAFLEEPASAECTSLRHVVCSGEALTHDLQERFFNTLGCELHNLYGPTEAAVDVTHWTCVRNSRSAIVPIGHPVSNTSIHILDQDLRPVAPGTEGELHIGGVQVGMGYHNRPELTAEKFLPDPFSAHPGARLYKTGDLARILPDGAIEYLGRIDFQVKIRGFRIELGEIESALGLHPAVSQAVVLAVDDGPGERRLAAYLSRREQHSTPTVGELRTHLLASLPEYMIPSAFCWIEQIPLSPNGKVDRKALPSLPRTRPDLAQAFSAPRSALEQTIAALWQQVLRVDPVGIDDRFLELGGDSLRLAQIHQELQKRLSTPVPITALFQFATIRELAAHLAPASTQSAPPARVSNGSIQLDERARRQRAALAGIRPRQP